MIFILLPAYNEERALGSLVPLIAESQKTLLEPFEIVVVNDGSRDQTSALLKRLSKTIPLHEIKHSPNQGYGAALRSGYQYVLSRPESNDSIVVSLDADGTHGPSFIPRLVQKIRDGFDMVTASYILPGGSLSGVPPYRALFSRTVNGMFQVCCPVPGAQTYSNGFRAYRVSILHRVAERFGQRMIEDTGFAGGTELFLKSAACGGRAAEVPFDLHYELRGKESKIRFLPTILGYLTLMARARKFR